MYILIYILYMFNSLCIVKYIFIFNHIKLVTTKLQWCLMKVLTLQITSNIK